MANLRCDHEKRINRHEALHENFDNSGDNLRKRHKALRRIKATKQIFPEWFQNEDAHVV